MMLFKPVLFLSILLASTVVLANSPEAMREAAMLDAARLSAADSEVDNWLAHGRTYGEQRFSPLDDIDVDNVSGLGLAWSFDTDHNRGLESSPIVIDGVMYSTGNWSVVYANDAATGELLWKHDPKVDKSWAVYACCDVVNRGVAVWGGKVFVGTIDGYLVALDAGTGEEIWRSLTIDKEWPYTITGAPRIIKGKVIIGNGGAEYGVRGYVTAYDAETGKQAWRFWTVPGNPDNPPENEAMAMALKTWGTEFPWWETGGGGTVWDSMAYDPELDQLYIGVGNAQPWNRNLRNPQSLDNLFVSSIVSLNPDTGDYLWHYQETPNDGWDYTATQHILLADIEWKGEIRKVILHAPKNGFFFIIDRATGEFLSAEPYARVTWATAYDSNGRPIENPDLDYSEGKKVVRPSPTGAHNWQPMSYSPLTGLVYIPAMDSLFEYAPASDYNHEKGFWNLGMEPLPTPPGEPLFQQAVSYSILKGFLLAWDPVKQQEVWRVPHRFMWNGGVLSTAGNLVFQGNAEQNLVAYRADTGEKVWEYPTQTGIIAPPVTYRVNGEQYIAVQTGWGGAFGLAGGIKPPPGPKRSRILAFRIGGDHKLPAVPERVIYDPPPRMDVSDDVVEEGRVLYNSYCSGCHAITLEAMNGIPDLRYMHSSRHEGFKQIVLGGALRGVGMVSFAEVLDERQADAVHAYILDVANVAKEERDDPQPAWLVKAKKWLYGKIAQLIDENT
jgi:quinohemoprotein ethanol dehydrogenase